MDILSKGTLAVVESEEFRRAVDELLTKSGAPNSITVVRPTATSSSGSSTDESRSKSVVTLRRLAV